MLFHVKMTVKLPANMDLQVAARLKSDEKELAQRLQQEGSLARRYFCPSLESLSFLGRPAAELQDEDVITPQIVHSTDIASRILCLPLYSGLEVSEILGAVRIIVNRHVKAA